MDTLDLNRKDGSYGRSWNQFFVQKTKFNESSLFEVIVHSYKQPMYFSVLKVKFNGKETFIFTGVMFQTNKVQNFQVIESISCPENPLFIGISTIDNITNYYSCRYLLTGTSTLLKNQKAVGSKDLLNSLNTENLIVNSETFNIGCTEGYQKVKVEKGSFYEDFINITHTTDKTFSFLNINGSLKCSLENYNSSTFNSSKLEGLCAYFHINDTKNYYPLFLEFKPKHNFSTVYYKLTDIESELRFQKINNSSNLEYDQIVFNLNQTYLRLRDKFTQNPNSSLLNYAVPNSFTVNPFLEDDGSDNSGTGAKIGALFALFFIGGGISFFIYQFYVNMKTKYY